MISVVIPTLNDTAQLLRTLEPLAPIGPGHEVIVVDGGSEDGLEQLAAQYPQLQVLEAAPGRASQMNRGAAAARGEVLLFLHADTLLPPDWTRHVNNAARQTGFALGAFRMRLAAPGLPYRLIESLVNLRSRWLRLPFGDQALFMKASTFNELGGFPAMPLMEDVELVRRARTRGRLVVLSAPATSSARNWERDGILYRTFMNGRSYLAYRLGRPVDRIAAAYPGRRRGIAVFCKEPVPGTVKTRLARTLGADEAAGIYRHIGRATVDHALSCPGAPKVVVFHDPPGAEPSIREWLGPGIICRPQRQGDLGRRMYEAFATLRKEGYDEVLLVGTDCPALTARGLHDAFRKLAGTDVVLGPTPDGGYYLVGAKDPPKALLADIPWSTGQTFARTVEELGRKGQRVASLPALRDIDDEEDWNDHLEGRA
jgi:rSAM/selenodomain-associated transferase 2/rSAM/selenodomain-associated transferase 1